jgi:FSR family fosmidomycin resistance protein-like MFS transporter
MVTDIYQGALPAVLPFLKQRLSLTYTMAGIILMTATFTSSLIQPLFGYLSDHRDKTYLLPAGCFCAGIGFSFLSVAESYGFVLLLVILSGLGIASYHPEGYKTAHFFTGEKRVTGMAVFSVGGNLGLALGPVLAIYIITAFGFTTLPIMSLPALLFTIAILFFWKSIAIPAPEVEKEGEKEIDSLKSGVNRSALSVVIAVVIVRSWIQMGLMSYIPFYYIDHLQGDPLYAGKLVSVFLMGGVMGTLAGAPLADRWGHRRYLILSMSMSALVLPLIFIAGGYALLFVLGLLGMILISTFAVTIVMAQQLMPRNLGIASGLMVGFGIGAGGLCVTLLGVVADHYGVPAALKSITFLPFFGLLLSLALRYPEPRRQERHG